MIDAPRVAYFPNQGRQTDSCVISLNTSTIMRTECILAVDKRAHDTHNQPEVRDRNQLPAVLLLYLYASRKPPNTRLAATKSTCGSFALCATNPRRGEMGVTLWLLEPTTAVYVVTSIITAVTGHEGRMVFSHLVFIIPRTKCALLLYCSLHPSLAAYQGHATSAPLLCLARSTHPQTQVCKCTKVPPTLPRTAALSHVYRNSIYKYCTQLQQYTIIQYSYRTCIYCLYTIINNRCGARQHTRPVCMFACHKSKIGENMCCFLASWSARLPVSRPQPRPQPLPRPRFHPRVDCLAQYRKEKKNMTASECTATSLAAVFHPTQLQLLLTINISTAVTPTTKRMYTNNRPNVLFRDKKNTRRSDRQQ